MIKIVRLLIIPLIICFIAQIAMSQTTINWRSWEEVQELSKTERRKVIVDVYTQWCGWCKKMDKATFQKAHIAHYINENYYAIKFDAEYKNRIEFKEAVYEFVNTGKRGYHELAANITKNELRYPTIVILDEQLNVIQPIQGFQDPTTLELILTFYAGDYHKTTPWKKYTRSYNSKLRHVHTVGNE